MPKVIGINGIYNFSRRNQSTDKMLDLLKQEDNIDVYDYNYNWSGVITNYFRRGAYGDAKKLLHVCNKDDTVFAFSRGGRVIHAALEMGLEVRNVILFSVAVENDIPWGAGAKHIYNVYHPNDFWIKMGSWLPGHPFGDLGRKPYNGVSDSRIKNIDASKINKDVSWDIHQDYWAPENIHYWKNFIEEIHKS